MPRVRLPPDFPRLGGWLPFEIARDLVLSLTGWPVSQAAHWLDQEARAGTIDAEWHEEWVQPDEDIYSQYRGGWFPLGPFLETPEDDDERCWYCGDRQSRVQPKLPPGVGEETKFTITNGDPFWWRAEITRWDEGSIRRRLSEAWKPPAPGRPIKTVLPIILIDAGAWLHANGIPAEQAILERVLTGLAEARGETLGESRARELARDLIRAHRKALAGRS